MRALRCATPAILLVLACGDSGSDGAETTAPATLATPATTPDATTTAAQPTTGDAGTAGMTSAAAGDSSETGFKFDLGDKQDLGDTDSGVVPTCKVVDDMDAVQPCVDKAPPDSYDPEVQWSWMGDNGEIQAFAIPLIANLTDDNGDGEIDLCDTPDVVIQAFVNYGQWNGSLYVLDGATGSQHWKAPVVVDTTITPALGDIDADGVAEIVAFNGTTLQFVAFEHTGEIKWETTAGWPDYTYGAIGMADLDNDGEVV